MGFRIKRGGGSGSLTLPNELIFADTITRDDYFTTNPSKLKDNVYVSVGGTLQKYVDSTWVDSSAVVKGAPGDDAPEMLIQYSATGNSGWSETMNVALHKFWRWSKDSGVTWSQDGVRFSGGDGGDVDLTGYFDKATYDPTNVNGDAFNMSSMVETELAKILTASERAEIAKVADKQDVISAANRIPENFLGDGSKALSSNDFTTTQKDKLANIQERFLGIFADDTARDTAYPTPANGQYCKQENTDTFWFYGAGVWTNTGGSSGGDMLAALYDPQDIGGDAFDRANHTGEQAIGTVTGLQIEIDKLPVIQTEIDATELQINEPTNGILKRLADVELGGNVVTGAATTIVSNDLPVSRVVVSDLAGKVGVSLVTSAELDVLDGNSPATIATIVDNDQLIINSSGNMRQMLMSRMWTYISGKFGGGAISGIVSTNLTVSRALVTNALGKIVAADVTSTEIAHLDGVTANIQAQLNSKKSTASNALRVSAGGTISTTGTKLSGIIGSFSIIKVATGHYRISGLPSSSAIGSMVLIECDTDDDNSYTIYDKSTTSFNVKFWDMPNMAAQDTQFRFWWVTLF